MEGFEVSFSLRKWLCTNCRCRGPTGYRRVCAMLLLMWVWWARIVRHHFTFHYAGYFGKFSKCITERTMDNLLLGHEEGENS